MSFLLGLFNWIMGRYRIPRRLIRDEVVGFPLPPHRVVISIPQSEGQDPSVEIKSLVPAINEGYFDPPIEKKERLRTPTHREVEDGSHDGRKEATRLTNFEACQKDEDYTRISLTRKLEHLIRINPKNPDYYIHFAYYQYDKGNSDVALSYLKMSLKKSLSRHQRDLTRDLMDGIKGKRHDGYEPFWFLCRHSVLAKYNYRLGFYMEALRAKELDLDQSDWWGTGAREFREEIVEAIQMRAGTYGQKR